MRSLLIMAAFAAAVILLSGCRDKKPEPVPGPQAALTQRMTADPGRQANTAPLFRN
jgi:uncharacterized lipoprotein YbaY